MTHRIIAIVLIYLCTAATWIALGTTVTNRTEEYDAKLRSAMGELWGKPQRQEAPTIASGDATGHGTPVTLQSSNLTVDIGFEPRQKGLLWYSTYRVRFSGTYEVTNPSESSKSATFKFRLPAEKAVYDDVKFLVGGREISDLPVRNGNLSAVLSLAPGQKESVEVRYVTNGMDEWWYDFGAGVNQVRNFSLTMNTDFDRIDFPENGISPTDKEQTSTGWKLEWRYKNLLSNIKIGMAMPHKLNPGPWVSRVSFGAPISLFLFFFLLFIISTLRRIRIHPMHYFFIGAAFFSFHLLLAYMVDHFSMHASFITASVVSVALVISYMKAVIGARFAYVEVGLSQLVFLVLFSYSFFFSGYTGLTITVLCVVTLFVTMKMTARLDWDEVFRKEGTASVPERSARQPLPS